MEFILFTFKDKIYEVFNDRHFYLYIKEYSIEGKLLNSHTNQVVKRFFEHFGIEDHKEWLSSIYGYEANDGIFPEWEEEDDHLMGDKVLEALKYIYARKGKVSCSTNLLLLI